jgi:fucose 4-O-acetylase-like acetyltransferase
VLKAERRSFSLETGAAGQNVSAAYRGLLICAIVIGHNRLIVGVWPLLFPLLYFWHVQGFFLEAAGRRSTAYFAKRRITDLMVRYLVPYTIFCGMAAGIALFLGTGNVQTSLLPLAIWNGFAATCEQATGLSLFWFLPTFASFSAILVLRARIDMRNHALRKLADIFLAVLALIVAVVPSETWALFMPMGLLLAIYFVPLALAWRVIDGLSGFYRKLAILLSAGIAIAQIHAIYSGERINVSLYELGIDVPNVLLTAAAVPAMALLVSTVVRYLPRQSILRVCGEYSIVIFLGHPFIQAPLTMIVGARLSSLGKAWQASAGFFIVFVSIGCCLVGAMMLERIPRLRAMVLPRDWASWRAAWIGPRPSV